MNIHEILAENLDYLRMRKDMSRTAFARACNVTYSVLFSMLNGKNASLKTIECVAESLGIEPWQLIKEDGVRIQKKVDTKEKIVIR